jgi:hypothetical protein
MPRASPASVLADERGRFHSVAGGRSHTGCVPPEWRWGQPSQAVSCGSCEQMCAGSRHPMEGEGSSPSAVAGEAITGGAEGVYVFLDRAMLDADTRLQAVLLRGTTT